ncbi:uncharacterized protein LOC120000687 [Tripterygium wilfordii]|uniref:uncharacterized protein LOC120000687 n=1 Tax=Tripterygium wilfordii TaxID=458696 RepID=UPI0018F84ACF|nr:uncharacterized protein LOC120000687 [Tripterygium wilfordii]
MALIGLPCNDVTIIGLLIFENNKATQASKDLRQVKSMCTLGLALNYGEAYVKTKKIDKQAVLNREVSNGDLIDCVDKREGEAFCNSLLRGHKIQGEPKQSLRTKKYQLKSRSNKTSQIWSKNETPYPKDHTAPIRHSTYVNTMRANSTSNFKRKQHSFYRQLRVTGEHEFATAIYHEPQGVYGVAATINYWKPSVEMGARSKEYSSGFIRIKSGTNDNFDLIEAGWHVFPWFYTEEGDTVEDDKTRFFIFWTNDSRNGLTCYNVEYSGFVLEGSVEPGSEFYPTSVYNGEQRDMFLGIWKDSRAGRWKLMYNDIVVGHWPENLFTHLRTRGTHVEWGGEVFNTKNEGRFTSTEMGSGHFAHEGYRRASYFRDLQVKTSGTGNTWIPVSRQRLSVHTTSPRYYTFQFESNIGGSGHDGFFYGGPGNNNNPS